MTSTDPNPDAHSTHHLSGRSFADFPISPQLLRGITDKGYRYATPVQAATIEAALAGRDMVARAKTGTGKTAAFSVPLLERIDGSLGHAQALILAPVRELALQTAQECEALADYLDLGVALLVGGVPLEPQQQALAGGAALVVGTPGRVLDMARRGHLNLAAIQHICLDEADEMLSMGFYEDVTSIIEKCAPNRQILLFSATISGDTERIVSKYLNEPEQVFLSTDSDPVQGIEHMVYEAPQGLHRVRALLYLLDLENPDAAIVFCNTREDTNTVASFLDKQGVDVQLLSGELSQSRRNTVMKRVKSGEVRFLVATDVAARGIDISDLSHVINYALPNDPTVYLHRIGRTGRIGKQGTAVSLVSAADFSTRSILATTHGIDFQEHTFPDEAACVARRVERQAAQIEAAMGSLVFESYLPTVDRLLELPKGKAMLAAALRGFFVWDRQRRALINELVLPKSRSTKEKPAKNRHERGNSSKPSARGRRKSPQKRPAAKRELDALLIEEPTDTKRGKPSKRAKRAKGSSAQAPKRTPTTPSSAVDLNNLDDWLSSD